MTGTSKLKSVQDSNLSKSDREFINRIASRIQKSGLVTPAVFFMELFKPLALLGSHTMVFFGPIISAFIRADGYYRAAELFEEPSNVEFLIAQIERLEKEQKEKNEGDMQ
ncbi:MAG: hypothetical protein P8Z37_13025 [Acidobacteriota bacterium]